MEIESQRIYTQSYIFCIFLYTKPNIAVQRSKSNNKFWVRTKHEPLVVDELPF